MPCLVNLKNRQLVQILVILSACFSSIGSGMHYAWTSPTIPKMVSDDSLDITVEQTSYFLVCQGISMAITAPISSTMIDKVGRKTVGLLVAIPHIIGWILVAFARNVWVIYLAKFIVGIGESAYYASIPVYICEISEPDVRQGWANMISVALYSGIFLVNVIGAYMSITTTALICISTSIMHMITFSWVPESPYYLIIQGRLQHARKSLQTLGRRDDVEMELAALTNDVNRQLSEKGTWKNLISIRSNRKAVVIAAGVRIVQQLSGLSAYETYAQYMFNAGGVDISASASAIIFSALLTLGPAVGALVISRFGRKPLLIYSTLGCGVCLASEAIYFAMRDFTNIDVWRLYWFPLCGMVLYEVFCSLGLATLPSLIAGEMFSASIKAKATIASNIMLVGSVVLTPKLFQSLTQAFGIFSPFCFFGLCCFLGVTFIYLFVIETKDKTLEEIQQELKQK